MPNVHSFDVLDTSLIRRVAAPTDVFRLIGWRIARIAGVASPLDFTEDAPSREGSRRTTGQTAL